MPLVNPYCTLTTLKAQLRITGGDDDAILESLITTASRQIDEITGRRFYATTETRLFTPERSSCLALPNDLRTVTTLKTDEDGDRTFEITWATTDYYLTPVNAALDGRPYTGVQVDSVNGRYTFPLRVNSVQIAGSFGYCATNAYPAIVEEACLLRAAWLNARRTTPLGVAGTPETGIVRLGTDRDLEAMLWPVSRRLGFA